MAHFHVATGLSGYGPDGADGFNTGETWSEVANLINDELRDACNPLADAADDASVRRDYERYHAVRELSDRLAEMQQHLDGGRLRAPYYAGDVEKWGETVRSIVEKYFPLDLDPDGRIKLYAWQCETADSECEDNADAQD